MQGVDPDSIQLLFAIICSHAPSVEHEQIKRILGTKLVEDNEVKPDETMLTSL
jgi:hypothetical protein